MGATGLKTKVLFVPSVREGDGIGHLKRCLELVSLFSEGAVLNEERSSGEDRLRRVAASIGIEIPDGRIVHGADTGGRWELIVLDRRQTSANEMERLERYGPLLGLDEGGEARRFLPYLIDTLPLPGKQGKANIYSTAFQSRPRKTRASGAIGTGQVLVTFGGEDLQGLTGRMTQALIAERHYPADRITVVIGPLFRRGDLPSGVRVLYSPRDLQDRLWEYDVVFTSFGLTAYEAAHAGVSVVLLNPTAYHRQLCRIAGFPEIGVASVSRRSLKRLLSDPEGLLRRCSAVVADGAVHDMTIADGAALIAARVKKLDFSIESKCPVCGRRGNGVVARFPERSFFQCSSCSMVYEMNFSPLRPYYDRRYFVEEYRQQYGRTYLEDFENIRRFAEARLDQIEKAGLPVRNRSLLDVGCAFGPFLVEASQRGARVLGVDIALEAVDYVRNTLGLPCEQAALEEFDLAASFGLARVDILTMWYVIEHFPRLGPVLKKINSMLAMGGILAFSTPNRAGISGRTNLQRFLERSPHDHYTLWDPRIARAVLGRFGFRVVRVRVTGHHPERFPFRWHRPLLLLSKGAGLGDTFECYAEKISEITK